MATRLALLSCLALLADVRAWTYDRCDLQAGPSAWGGQCGTPQNPQMAGTPINLCGAIPFEAIPTFKLNSKYKNITMNVVNEGKTIQANVLAQNPPMLSAGKLAHIVGHTKIKTPHEWALAQIHVHWGRDGSEGSEHYMQGKRYPLEAHLVHYNTKYGSSLTTALNNATRKYSDLLLVVGVFFEVGATDVPILKKMADKYSQTIKKEVPLNKVSPKEFFDGTGAFYSYKGSLTTPQCLEVVTWVVMQKPKSITQATLNKFLAVKKDANELTSKYGSYRPLQLIGNRKVWSSSGATDACKPVQEPVFPCSKP